MTRTFLGVLGPSHAQRYKRPPRMVKLQSVRPFPTWNLRSVMRSQKTRSRSSESPCLLGHMRSTLIGLPSNAMSANSQVGGCLRVFYAGAYPLSSNISHIFHVNQNSGTLRATCILLSLYTFRNHTMVCCNLQPRRLYTYEVRYCGALSSDPPT